MKTKLTLLWLILIVALNPLGNSVFASSDHASRGHKTSFRSTTNPPDLNLDSNPPFAQPKTKVYANQVPVAGESIRIGTYNFQFWPWGYEDVIPGIANLCCDNIGDRERKVAERVLASGYDIIAFNEVWDEDAKDHLVQYLSEQYPYFVKYVEDADEAVEFQQDSGLMLFSRFPFEVLPLDTYKVTNQGSVKFSAQYEGQSWEEVAFIEYNNCSGDDCLANKGAGYVRIRNPHTGRIYNVVFTHLNAGDSESRRLQLQDVERLITSTMLPEQIAGEDIFFLGDMNINGNHLRECRTEWDQNFGDGTPINPACGVSEMINPFFHNVLHDAREYEMQPGLDPAFRDPGLTGGIHKGDLSRSRVDYILRSWPPPTGNGQLCMQQMTVAYNLRYGDPYVEVGIGEAGTEDLSDHYGLNADLNLWAPYCSPASARTDLPFDQWVDGQITHPGSMQWYYFESPGTYSISVRSDGPVDFQVYKSTDLSSPIARRGEPTGRWTFNLPEGHFYVRVFARDRAWSGAYQIMMHQHAGRNPSEAIVLFPNQPIFRLFGETTWFRMMTEALDSGQAQNLRIFADSVSPADTLTMDLFAADATTLIASSSSGAPEILRSDIADNNQTMFLRVRRSQAGEYRVGWITNLTVLYGTAAYPLKMRCDEQTELGIDEDDDHVKFSLFTEGTADEHKRIDNKLLLENWDEGRVRGLGDIFQVTRFTQELVVEVNEEDDWPNPNDILQARIMPIPVEQQGTAPATIVLYDKEGADYDGEYRFYYNLSHGLEFGFHNDPFVVDAGPDRESPEGEIVELPAAPFIDFGIATTYVPTIDWGDGSPTETGTVEISGSGGNLHFGSHIYGDNSIYTVNICVTADGTRTACDTLNVSVFNIAPSANIDLSAATLINGVQTFFTRAGKPTNLISHSTDPGSDDLVLHWDLGDGSPISEIVYQVNPPDPDPFPSPSVQPRGVMNVSTHTFALAYLYTIKYWATDDDGGISPVDTAIVVVTGNARAGQTKPTGYWQKQYGRQGQSDFDEPTLIRYLAINDFMSEVFHEVRYASTIPSAYDVLFMQQNRGDARQQLDRELLTTWLNFANGAIEYHQRLDTNNNHKPDTAFAEIIASAEAIRLNPASTDAKIRHQKNLLHRINR
jgi:hypothetical protein